MVHTYISVIKIFMILFLIPHQFEKNNYSKMYEMFYIGIEDVIFNTLLTFVI